MAEVTTVRCPNCRQQHAGQYCQFCGQRAGVQPFTMRLLLRQVPQVLFDVDRGLWHTLKGLCLRPGEVINSYLDGQRVRYTNPFTLMLLFVGINAVLFPSGLVDLSQISRPPPGMEQQLTNFMRGMFQYFSMLLLLALPLASAITRWCFAAWPRNYAEHLVINAYITGETVAFFTCLFPCFALLSLTSWFGVAWNMTIPLSLGYNAYVLTQVFGTHHSRGKVVLRAIAAGLLYLLSVTVPAFVIGFVYALRVVRS